MLPCDAWTLIDPLDLARSLHLHRGILILLPEYDLLIVIKRYLIRIIVSFLVIAHRLIDQFQTIIFLLIIILRI